MMSGEGENVTLAGFAPPLITGVGYMSNVLVIGASAGIGLEVVSQGLTAGHHIRAMARSADRIRVHNPSLEKFVGDALKPKDVEAALKDIEVVVQVLGLQLDAKMVLGPVSLFSEATKILLAAMKKAGVTRLLCVTGFGAGDSRYSLGCLQNVPFQIVFGRAYGDKTEQEQMVKNSGLDWTIVRPGILTNGPRTGRYQVLSDPETWKNGIISRADVADFLTQQFNRDTYLEKAPVLVN